MQVSDDENEKEKYDGNYKSDNIVEEGKEHEDMNITSGK